MSLSIPYLLVRAVEARGSSLVQGKAADGPWTATIDQLDTWSTLRAQALLAAGYRPGDTVTLTGDDRDAALDRLGASRIGVVVADADPLIRPAAGGRLADGGPLPDPAELEMSVWSQTPLLRVDGVLTTHGEFLAAVLSGTVPPWWPADLVSLVRALIAR